MDFLKKEFYNLLSTGPEIVEFLQEFALDGLSYSVFNNEREIWINPKLRQVMGIAPSEVFTGIESFTSSADSAESVLLNEPIVKTLPRVSHPFEQSVCYKHQKGYHVWLKRRSFVVFDEDQNPSRIVSGYQQISDPVVADHDAGRIHRSEQTLMSSEERLNLVIKGSNDAPWDWNLANDELWYSDQWWIQIGYLPGELPPDSGLWERLMHPDDKQHTQDIFGGALATGLDSYQVEFRLKHKQGHYVPLLSRGFITRNGIGKPIRVTGTNMDLSGLRKAEEALRLSETKFRTLFDTLQVGVTLVDEQGNIVSSNGSAEKILGLSKEQQQQRVNDGIEWSVIRPDGSVMPRDEYASVRAMKENKLIHDVEMGVIRGKNDIVWIIVNAAPMPGLGVVVSYQEITKRIIAESKIREAQEKLLEKNKELELLLNDTGFGIWKMDIATGSLDWDKYLLKLLQSEHLTEFSYDYWAGMLHPEDRIGVERAFGEFLQGKAGYDVEYRIILPDGQTRYNRSQATAITNAQGRATKIIGITKDTTDRKLAEATLRRVTTLLNDAQRIANMGAWDLDLQTGKTFWTDEVYTIHEVEKDFDHNKVNGIAFYHPDYQKVITDAIQNTIEKHERFDVTCAFITAKGNHRWVRSSGYPLLEDNRLTHIIGMFQDVTQIEADKEAIRREQSFSRQLLQSMSDGFSVIDGTGTQIDVNEAFTRFTGFTSSELVGKTAPYPYWPEEELDHINECFQHTLNHGGGSYEMVFRRKSGERFPVILSSSMLKDSKGTVTHFLANIKDVTKQKAAEKELRLLLNLTKDQNERLKNFTYIVSHNLRSHASNIQLLLYALIKSAPEFEQSKILKATEQASQNLITTIKHLTEVASCYTDDPEQFKMINFSEIIRQTIQNVKALASDAHVQIINEVPLGQAVSGVAAYLESIVINLLTNAIKYRSPERQCYIKLSSRIADEFLILNVEDNGLGIDLEKHGAQLFGMYKTFHKHKDSRGVGLFITRSQVEAIGGRIEVTSEVNKGTTFSIFFKSGADKPGLSHTD